MASFSLPPPPAFMQPINDTNNAFTGIQYDDSNDSSDDIINKFKNRANNAHSSSRSGTPTFGQVNEELSAEDQQINEEYFIWKKNTPYLYDVLVSHDLEWPSLTCQFLPQQIETKSHTQHKLLLGTHTSNNEMNQLLLTQIYLPKDDAVIQKDKHYPVKNKYDVINTAPTSVLSKATQQQPVVNSLGSGNATTGPASSGGISSNDHENVTAEDSGSNNTTMFKCIKGGYGGVHSMYKVEVQINHPGSINVARYMPQEPLIIATKSGGTQSISNDAQPIDTTGDTLTMDVDDDDDGEKEEEEKNATSKQDGRNPTTAATNVDPNVYIFHIGKHPSTPLDIHTTRPEMILKGHSSSGYALTWSHITKGMLLSASDDGTVCLYRIQTQDIKGGDKETVVVENPMQQIIKAHDGVINDVQWHSVHPTLFGTVGDDSAIKIWNYKDSSTSNNDSTSTLKPIIHLKNQHNKKEINCIQFNLFNQYIFATGGGDNNINIWDLRSCINARNTGDKAMPLHVLKQHTDAIYSLRFSPHDEHILASSGNDRRVIMWDLSKMTKKDEDIQDTIEDCNNNKKTTEHNAAVKFIHCGHTMSVNDVSFNHSDRNVICTVGNDNVLQIWKEKSNYYVDKGEDEDDKEEEDMDTNNDQDNDNNSNNNNNNNENEKNDAPMMMVIEKNDENSCTMLLEDEEDVISQQQQQQDKKNGLVVSNSANKA